MSEEEKILLLKTNLELSIKLEKANHVIEEWQKRYCKYRHYIIKEKSKRRKEDLIKENDVLKERIDKAIEYITGNMQYDDNIDDYWTTTNELLEILKGGSDE